MLCKHCHKTTPSRGYCCTEAELEALRTVIDEAAMMLNSELIEARSIGALDVVESVQLVHQRLRAVRVA